MQKKKTEDEHENHRFHAGCALHFLRIRSTGVRGRAGQAPADD